MPSSASWGKNTKTPMLVAVGKDGKELRRYDGMAGGKRDFCVTDRYVVCADPDGNICVFEKKSAKRLGNVKLNLRPFALWTLERDKVLVYDDGGQKAVSD
ncbi:MAG: hypothetical protein IJ521_11125 [Schwartzia sp.]|nr:hypothetical protein [Schwartzia sp. (in: firmicutes)]